MKEWIISILEPVLSIFVIAYTLIGFIGGGAVGGLVSRGLFDEPSFHLGWALVGGGVFFLVAIIGTGAIFTLLAIKELLEEQIGLLREAERRQQARS